MAIVMKRKVELEMIMTGMDPTAMQSVRFVTGLEGMVTRQNVAWPSILTYLGRSGGIDSSKWEGDLDRTFCRDGSSTSWKLRRYSLLVATASIIESPI